VCQNRDFWDQLVGDCLVLHALADLAGDEIADQVVGFRIGQDVAEIALPDAETAIGVEFLEECLAFLRRDLEDAARVWRMQETGERLLTAFEHFRVADADLLHFLGADPAVVQRGAPVWRALEHGEVTGGFRYLLDGLHAGRAGADNRDAFAFEVDLFARPAGGVEGLAFECLDPLDPSIVGADNGPMAVIRKRARKCSPFSIVTVQVRCSSS